MLTKKSLEMWQGGQGYQNSNITDKEFEEKTGQTTFSGFL